MVKFRPLPRKERLCELFRYEESEGVLYWKERHNSQINLDKPAGWSQKNGYHGMTVDGVKYKRHRLIWCFFNGEPGNMEVDHINGVKNDDRIENLRLATRRQNQYNRAALATNKSGYKGVSLHECGNWIAQITDINGKRVYLGHYKTPEEAAVAYAKAALELHRDFCHHSVLEFTA